MLSEKGMGSFSLPYHTRARLRSPSLHYLAVVAFVTGVFLIYFWLTGIYNRLETISSSHDRALAALELRESEQKALQDEVSRLQGSRDADQAEKAAQMAKLEEGKRGAGYAHFENGQVDGADDIVVAIKTGATEADKKVPAHLLSTLTHTTHAAIFSDHEQKIGAYMIQDALNETGESIMQDNSDFDVYRDQKSIMTLGQDPEMVKLQGAWDLDKYKNIPMMVKTYRQFPNAKWYLFLDADSYVLLANLVSYLERLDSTADHYIGSAATIDSRLFAHGGTGYVLSHGLVSRLLKADPDFIAHHEDAAMKTCCGDFALAEVFREYNVEVNNINPRFNGDPYYLSTFDESRWCMPLFTMHHLQPDDVTQFWSYEREAARPGKFILFKDVFERFIYPALQDERVGWNNMGDDRGWTVELPSDLFKKQHQRRDFDDDVKYGDHSNGHGSVDEEAAPPPLSEEQRREIVFEACKKMCQDRGDCMQYMALKEECKIYDGLELGWKAPVAWADHNMYRSGWMMDRVEQLRKRTCDGPDMGW